jgi:MFS family permease
MNKSIGKAFVVAKILESASAAWFFGTYILFLQGIGIDLLGASLLNTIFMGLSSVLDPFTGNIGDRVGQKKIYLFGLIMWSISHIAYWMSGGFWGCAVAEVIGAIGLASRSEALESWLRNHSDEDSTHKAMAKGAYWGRIATIPTAIIGGIVGAKYGLEWPWLISGVTGIASALITGWWLRDIPEHPVDHKPSENDLQLWSIAKNAWADPILRRTFVLTALMFACFQPFNMFWPVVFRDATGQAQWLGSMWIGIALASALGSKLAEKWVINSKGLAMIVLSIGIPMILTPIRGNWILILLIPFVLHEIGRSMWLPVLWSYTNRRISNHTRTSVNSLRSSAGTAGAVLGLLVSGMLTKVISPTQVWGVSAVVLIAVAYWVYGWNHDA